MLGRIIAAILIAGFALVSIPNGISAEPRNRGRSQSRGSDRGRGWGQHRNRRWHNNRWYYDSDPGAFWGGIFGGIIGQSLRPDRDEK